METLRVYLPMDRRQALVRGERLPDRTSGAALFADVSGFTPLAEGLARDLGPQRGAEELTRQLNAVYEALIAEVDRYGGSVVGFSGDGITCWFDKDDGLRATTSALAMQAAMAQFAAMPLPGGESVTLAMKTAVAGGPVRRFVVGDPRIQLMDVLAGATLDRLAATEDHTQKGEVVLSAETATALGESVRVTEWRAAGEGGDRFAVVGKLTTPAPAAPWPALPPEALTAEQIGPWLLPGVYERVRGGQGAFLAELRSAVVLFLHFGGIDYDGDPRAGDQLDAYLRWVQGVLAHYEGTLLQLTIGDKGSYLYAAFGAPLAHEDDAVRAVAAAQTLRVPPAELEFICAVQIGLSQGRMRAGPYGGSTRRTYGVLGDEVNVAARLMQAAAPGQLIASQRVASATTDAFAWQPLPPIQVKGKAKPIAIYQPAPEAPTKSTARSGHAQRPAAMVGRALERAALADALQTLVRGDATQVVIIEGEAGIGKSRLVDDLLRQADAIGVGILSGVGDAIEKSTPYYAWRSVFAQLFEPSTLTDPETQRRRLLELLEDNPERLRLAPLLNPILPFNLPDDDLTAQMSGQVRADNTRDVLIKLLQDAIARSPTALVLEDAQWLDSASWALAQAVSQRVRPLLLVIATRPMAEPLPDEYAQLLRAPEARRVRLQPLPATDALTLVRQRLGVAELPESVAALIQGKAEGNPFFSEELAYALRDAGLIEIAGGRCRVTAGVDLSAVALPDTVQGAITSRIDRIAPPQQLMLKVASVIGRVFAFHMLRDIYPIGANKPQLADHLNALERLDLTPLDTPEPELRYLFKHIITQEVAYNLMLFSQRGELHRAVGEWYERAFAKDLSPFYPALAHHWGKAEVASKTIDYLEKAGEQALRGGAYREAVGFFTEALKLANGKGQAMDASHFRRAHWEQQLGEAYLGLGELPDSRRHLEEALVLLGWPVPASRGKVAATLLGQIGRQVLHRRLPGRFVGRAHDRADTLLEAARAYERLVEIYYFSQERPLLLNAAFHALNLSESAGPSPELARAYANMCVAAGLVPLHGLAQTYAQQALDVAERVNHLPTRARALSRTGVYGLGIGRWTQAGEALKQAIAIADDLKDERQWGESSALRAQIFYYQGEFHRSREMFAGVYARARQNGNVQFQSWGLWGQSHSLLRLGRFDEAVAALTLALEVIAELSDRGSEIVTTGLLAAAYLRQGQPQPARSAADAVVRMVAESSRRFSLADLEGHAGAAEVFLALWESSGDQPASERQALAASAETACRATSRYARIYTIGRPRAWLLQGLYAWLSEKPRQAGQVWQNSLRAAEQLEMPYEQGRAHYEIGRHLDTRDPARAQHLTRARDIFARIGAVDDEARAGAASESMRSTTPHE